MNLEEIREKINSDEKKEVMSLTGLSKSMVDSVLRGDRINEVVVNTANEIVETRLALAEARKKTRIKSNITKAVRKYKAIKASDLGLTK